MTLPLAAIIVVFFTYAWSMLVLSSRKAQKEPDRVIVYSAGIALIVCTAIIALVIVISEIGNL